VTIDPYEVLGVKASATADELQKAYRRLAKKLHPDLNPGNKHAEEQFKNVAAAYDLLSNVEKRARFDRGEIDQSGAEKPRQRYYRDFAEGNGAAHPYTSDDGFADMHSRGSGDDIFADIFGRGRAAQRPARGHDVRYHLDLDFLAAVNGSKQTITLTDKSTLEVIIPKGTRDGQTLRLRGKGQHVSGEGRLGDALIQIKVGSHPFFKRDGNDIRVALPISLIEAVLGAKVSVPTLSGSVTMTIPKNTNTGHVLRLKGRGVALADGVTGDAYVTLQIQLPELPDAELQKFVSQWHPASTYNPRKAIEA
jgi:DnaJ-class molecular chaperone